MLRSLTATEERILEDMRAGLLDAEIAVRLGIPIGDLKRRITAMLRDFRLLSRDELLDLQPPGTTGMDEPAAPVAPAYSSRLASWAVVAAPATLLVVLASVLFVRPWESEATAVPRVNPTPAFVSLPPELVPEANIVERGVDFGHGLSLEGGFSLVLKAFAGSQAIGLDRVYRSDDGDTTVEALWRPPEGGRFTGVTTGQDGAIAVTFDVGEFSLLTVTSDGGVTWEAPRIIEYTRGPVHTGDFGTVLSPPTAGSGPYQLATSAGILELRVPLAAVRDAPVGVGPQGQLLWHAGGGWLIDGKGRRAVGFETNDMAVTWVSSVTWFDEHAGLVVWRSRAAIFASSFGAEGESRTLHGNPGWITGAVAPERFTGNYCQYALDGEAWKSPCFAVLYNPATATIHPVLDPRVVVDEFDPGTVVGGLAPSVR